jgi:hypothetical protein
MAPAASNTHEGKVLRGPRGPRGFRGPRGPRGFRGKRGPTGAQGPPGQAGLAGATGTQGPRGPAGLGIDRPGFTRTALDGNFGGRYSSIAIGSDGLPLISYDGWYRLRVAHCNDLACTSATTTTVEPSDAPETFSSVAIGSDGLGLISYQDGTESGGRRVAHCSDTACTSATRTLLDSDGRAGWDSSLSIGSDGLGVISQHAYIPGDLRVTHCSDVECTAGTTTTVDAAGDTGTYTSLAIGVDGLGLIAYASRTDGLLRVAHCSNVFCVPYFRRR